MSKITLSTVGSLIDSTTAAATINSNFSTLQTAYDNTLSRDGTQPDTMGANLDMNSNRILNLPAPISVNEPARLVDVTTNPTVVIPPIATALPLIDGTATIGVSTKYSPQDHIHPTDTTRRATFSNGQLPGTATNDSASAGNVGEYLVAQTNNISMTTGTPITPGGLSLSLTAGDWDVSLVVYFAPAASTTITDIWASINTTTGVANQALGFYNRSNLNGVAPVNAVSLETPLLRVSVGSTTTYYAVAQASFAVSTMAAYSIMRARRVR